MYYQDEVMELIYAAYKYEEEDKYNLAVSLLEKAVEIASQYDDIIFQMKCRFDLTDAYMVSGDVIKGVINFSWCVAQKDKGYVDENVIYQLLWQYKYIIDGIPGFLAIPCDKINKLFEEMKKLYLENNLSLSSYYNLKVAAAMHGVSDGIDIKEYYRKWITAPVDEEYSDCKACLKTQRMLYNLFLGNYEQALKEAENIINGRSKCAHVPHLPFGELILPIYSMGNYELADLVQRKGVRIINGNKAFIRQIGKYMMYFSLTNVEKGVKLFEKNYPISLNHNADNHKMWFNIGAYALFSSLKDMNVEKINIKIPIDAPIYSEEEYDVPNLKKHFENEAKKIIYGFDKRNGNAVISDDVKKHLEICGLEY